MEKKLMRGHINVQEILNGCVLEYTLKFKSENSEGWEWEDIKIYSPNLESMLATLETTCRKFESTNY